MNKNYSEIYNKEITNLINTIEEKEKDNIFSAATIIFNALKNKKMLHVFATGHSHMIAEEMFYRAGGLVQINPVLVPYLMQHEGAYSSTKYERISGLAKIIFDSLDLLEEEPFIIASNSGINAVPIEMAEIARKNNHDVIVITSYESSKNLEPRVESKKHLYDYASVLIDNHVTYGDCIISTNEGNIGACSTIAGAYIVQRIVLDVIKLCEDNNIDPLIYKSANTGGDEHNKKMFEEYKKRIRSLY